MNKTTDKQNFYNYVTFLLFFFFFLDQTNILHNSLTVSNFKSVMSRT